MRFTFSALACAYFLVPVALAGESTMQLPALADELALMARADQAARRQTSGGQTSSHDNVIEVDQRNTARLKEIVREHGWPTFSLVGEAGAHDAWLIVQHADFDRGFQKSCLTLMKAALQAKQVAARDVAYLEDRVRVGEGRPQLYGTQFRSVAGGGWEPAPIEDPESVDVRRKEIGLESMAEYRAKIEKVYAPGNRQANP